jgi:hypothetical protein
MNDTNANNYLQYAPDFASEVDNSWIVVTREEAKVIILEHKLTDGGGRNGIASYEKSDGNCLVTFDMSGAGKWSVRPDLVVKAQIAKPEAVKFRPRGAGASFDSGNGIGLTSTDGGTIDSEGNIFQFCVAGDHWVYESFLDSAQSCCDCGN